MSNLLLPAHAAFLLEPSSFAGGKCLQAALLTLAARGHVEIGERLAWFGRRALRLLDGDGAPLPPHLAAVKHALAANGRGSVLRAPEAIRALQRAFGNDYRRYIHDKLAPELIAMQLITGERRKWLGIIPYTYYSRTLTGEARAAPIRRLLEPFGDLKKLIRNDPDRAVALAASAGMLLVLSADVRRHIDKLKGLVERGSDGGSAEAGGHDGGDASVEVGVELGGIEITADLLGVLDWVGGVGDFTGDGDSGGDGDGGGD